MKPIRIQRKRTKGWKMPPNTVYVGRPTAYGNPFTGPDAVEKYRWALNPPRNTKELPITGSDVDKYIAWTDAGGNGVAWLFLICRDEMILDKLRGKNLCCWCPLDKPCHADILLELVNK